MSWQPPSGKGTPPPPPPPQYGSPPPAGQPYAGQPYGAPTYPGYAAPPGYPPSYIVGQPPRPKTKVAGWLMVAGAVVTAVGCFIPWLSGLGETANGFDQIFDDEPSGALFIFLAVVLLGFGIATVAAGRVLPIMIIGIVIAALSSLAAISELADYSDFADLIGIDLGPGLPVVLLGSLVALAGAIAGCAKRRRWPTPQFSR